MIAALFQQLINLVVSKFTIKNNKQRFEQPLTALNSLFNSENIRIGFESPPIMSSIWNSSVKTPTTASWKSIQPLSKNTKSLLSSNVSKLILLIANPSSPSLMTVEYKPHSKGFYHAYSLKLLTPLQDPPIRECPFYPVKITNVLDHTFPEFKPFFNTHLSKTALYLLENYGFAEKNIPHELRFL